MEAQGQRAAPRRKEEKAAEEAKKNGTGDGGNPAANGDASIGDTDDAGDSTQTYVDGTLLLLSSLHVLIDLRS